MTWNDNKWVRYLTALLVTVVVLVSAQQLWSKYGVVQPLDKGIQGIAGVEEVTWSNIGKNADRPVIVVSLGEVSDLQKTYNEILSVSQNVLGRKPFSVILKDRRTPELEKVYYDTHYYVQEAVVTGKFSAMAEAVKTRAAASQVEAKVYVDSKYMYVSLTHGQAALYSVVPRTSADQEVK
ncbi:MAG: hypothetical protein H6Q75_325 [Firmicutes bacterium]|nr:hypothetical protein [Bacillota bacterium]